MTITAAMAAALAVLTEALDDPDTDITQSLQLMTHYGASAVSSYRGLSVVVPHSDPPLIITTLIDGAAADDIRTSLHLGLPARGDPRPSSAVAIILYAGLPGAFVDLAADLAWLTSRPLGDFVLDEHLSAATRPRSDAKLHAASAINQAIGVLLGRGCTPEQADRELDAQAATHHTDRHDAARRILSTLLTHVDGSGCIDTTHPGSDGAAAPSPRCSVGVVETLNEFGARAAVHRRRPSAGQALAAEHVGDHHTGESP